MKKLFFLTFVVCLGTAAERNVSAQTFTPVYSFTNLDGGLPESGVIISGDTLYGTTTYGGESNEGVVFKVKTNGMDYTDLHVFAGGTDGSFPYSVLVLSGNTLYGTTHGDASDNGTVFAINTDGGGFTNLHTFSLLSASGTNIDGTSSFAGLIMANGILYGTAFAGGATGDGVVFAINTNSTGYTNLHTFAGADGANPDGPLLLFSNRLYGTTGVGGTGNSGTIFSLNLDGSGFSNLYSFTETFGASSSNSDGAFPQDGFVASGNRLYATTFGGGTSGSGAVIAINADGTGFTNLYSFTALDPVSLTNIDGAFLYDNLVLSGNTLYGTASGGGTNADGTIFSINTDGSDFQVLYNFEGADDGSEPVGGLTLSGNDLFYGMAQYNGSGNYGTIFSLSIVPALPLPPQLVIELSGTNVILTWATNVSGFSLQSNTNLLSPLGWTLVSPGAAVVNGLNTVTNPVSGPQQLYRLIY